jgi:hypothetical protein
VQVLAEQILWTTTINNLLQTSLYGTSAFFLGGWRGGRSTDVLSMAQESLSTVSHRCSRAWSLPRRKLCSFGGQSACVTLYISDLSPALFASLFALYLHHLLTDFRPPFVKQLMRSRVWRRLFACIIGFAVLLALTAVILLTASNLLVRLLPPLSPTRSF